MTDLYELESRLRALLKGEFSSLTISFNDDHACNYDTAKTWHDGGHGYRGDRDDRMDWASEDERINAIESNSVWIIQWYPSTPVGFCCVAASTLAAAVAAIEGQ